ncbi:MAG: hypothetical protein K2M06_08365 [Muribaculaceae bacterium]|nr:hypothetical protein [Muribaculaceae bacterium]
MCNEANNMRRALRSLAAGACGMLLLFGTEGCGPSAEERAAATLVGQAEALYDMGDYRGAIDSVKALDERYHSFTDLRRGGLRIRAMATEGLIRDSIEAIEPVLVQSKLAADSLRKFFVHIEPAAEGLDGYYLAATIPASSAMETTTIQPRVDEDGYLYLTANISGRSIGLDGLKIGTGNEAWTSGQISPSRVASVEGSDVASFAPEDLEGLGAWLTAHAGAKLTGTLTGTRGMATFQISAMLREAIVRSYEFSEAWQAERKASIQREKLERKLQAVRDQLANMPLPSQD